MPIRMKHDEVEPEGEALDEHQFEAVWKPLGWKKVTDAEQTPEPVPAHTNTAETGNQLAKGAKTAARKTASTTKRARKTASATKSTTTGEA